MLLLSAVVFGGCASEELCDEADHFASEVLEIRYGDGQTFGMDAMPDVVFGPPLGAGCCQGSTDVVSLGNGGSIVLGFSGKRIIDGPGVDFIVFENAFEGPQSVFAELAQVEVSADGVSWHGYPCDPSNDGSDDQQCAGRAPVYLQGDSGPIDVASAGGDGFDLADLGIAEARYVRITDRIDLQGFDGVFDLDAVGVVHGSCP